MDDNTIVTGSSDGLIRVVQIGPNRLLGVIGDHDDFPVERMASSISFDFVSSVFPCYSLSLALFRLELALPQAARKMV